VKSLAKLSFFALQRPKIVDEIISKMIIFATQFLKIYYAKNIS
jgi:hypothetical protein